MNVTTLENLPEAVRQNRLRNLAENIVKYQHFKSKEIIKNIDTGGYSQFALTYYIYHGINYIEKGVKNKKCGNLYKYIDEAMARHVQPLTPKQDQKRVCRIKRKQKIEKDTVLPINKTLEDIYKKAVETNNSKTQKTIDTIKNTIKIKTSEIFAVQMDKNIRLQNNIEEASAFLDGLSFMGKTDAKIIKIKIEEI